MKFIGLPRLQDRAATPEQSAKITHGPRLRLAALTTALCCLFAPVLHAQVPQLINYQGRVAVGTVNFDGSGQFKFALVNAAGTVAYWTNDGTHLDGTEPDAAVSLTVTKGLYSVLLGDTTLTNMTAIPASVWANADVRLRVWFNDGVHGFQLLSPDQRLAPNGYLPDGGITSAKIAGGAVGSSQLATGISVTGTLTRNASTATIATTATTAGNFTGNLVGDVTGHQGTTTVTQVAGLSAANVASGANLGNYLLGYGTRSVFVGAGAGNKTMSGDGNTAVGEASLQADTFGYSNTAAGYHSLSTNTGGNSNTALGYLAMYANSGGSSNTAVGFQTLISNTSGFGNIAMGSGSMNYNTSGYDNIAIGMQALYSNMASTFNTAIGFHALYYNSSGQNNTGIGPNALYANTDGSNNIALGFSAGQNLNGSNNIDIGHVGVAGESNTIRIGDGSTQTAAYITGISGATSSGGAAVFINSNGQLGTLTSSRRFKTDIVDMNAASECLLSLRPVTFRYQPEIDPKGIPQWGLIAEEVAAVNPELAVRDDKGQIQTVRYEQVNAMLLNEFLKEHKRVAELEKRLAELEAKDKARESRERKRDSKLAAIEQLLRSPGRPAVHDTVLGIGN